ncbi:DUF7286 family protein [Natronobacterium gregoryi]|uniref:Uncharacterized protein n=2 Tax=Natronobacterium gregoryi TaxID=44930 RepID=L0AF60_NATGS|nr:hypothetical protein [Natronobacterium gregoryi]AFZ72553.1 hypothetical protein Natgr_1336 [Natronobacterium gregoryi SP2]ELY74163.1 hypothetical protein C490_00640 [Natronobacterium gregoryi SP2]PLK21521.1 hypothetical protein CYV19_04330 [Natronobacterium gregoryi SP2]SFI75622.1 hypothetical protein SAMN05443661_1055 [Natronobacterium gregoryi]
MNGSRPRTVSVTLDDRARVPFAIIGVLLLLSSVTVVGVLESRNTPQADVDPMLAIDRTEPLVQSELREAVLRATDEAARAPLSTTADTPVGHAIDDPSESEFERYLELLIYIEAEKSLPTAGEKIRGDVETTVELEPVDWNDRESIETAIDRIDLDVGDGTLEATLDSVSIHLEGPNTQLRQEREITVTVGTTLFELRERTQEFEEQLETGFMEADGYEGFSRTLATRLYALTWAKTYYDRLDGDPSDRAFENITPNDHTEVLANDAVFAVQEDAFGEGAADPYEDRVMSGAAACLAIDLGDDIVETDLEDLETLCESEYLFGDADGDLEDPPTVQELLLWLLEDHVEGKQELEVHAHPFAEAAFAETTAFGMSDMESEFNETLAETERFDDEYLDVHYQDELGNTEEVDVFNNILSNIERVSDGAERREELTDSRSNIAHANIETDENTIQHGSLPRADYTEGPTGSENHSYKGSRHHVVSSGGADVTISERGDSSSSLERDLADIDIEFQNTVQERAKWVGHENASNETVWSDETRVEYTASFTVSGSFATDSNVDRSKDIETALEEGGAAGPKTANNFVDAPDKAIEQLFGAKSENRIESRIESQSRSILSENDFEEAIDYETSGEIDLESDDIDDWLEDELAATHLTVVTQVEPLEVDLFEMIEGESPIYEFESRVEQLEDELVYEGVDGEYENAPDMTRVELRQRYFDNLYAWIETMGEIHDDSNDAAGSMVDDLFEGPNGVLEESVGFTQDVIADSEHVLDGGSNRKLAKADDSSLKEDVYITVDGAPTYLQLEPVDREEVPAVRPEGVGPVNPENTTHAPLASKYENEVGFPGAPVIPWPKFFFLQLDAWQVEVEGEYARFKTRTTSGDGSSTDSTTYVRENKDVYLEAEANIEVEAGSVEAIEFKNSVPVVAFVPSPKVLTRGSPGIGDIGKSENKTETWNGVGPNLKGE